MLSARPDDDSISTDRGRRLELTPRRELLMVGSASILIFHAPDVFDRDARVSTYVASPTVTRMAGSIFGCI